MFFRETRVDGRRFGGRWVAEQGGVELEHRLPVVAGLRKGGDGFRTLADGKPWEVRISVGSASSDWLSVANVIAQNLAAVGVKARVDSKDWAVVVAGYEDGSFDTGIVWSNGGATPYQYYRGTMATATVKKTGDKATENYHRFGDPAADKALAAFASTSDEAAQKPAAEASRRAAAGRPSRGRSCGGTGTAAGTGRPRP